jgi:hypothetical protein
MIRHCKECEKQLSGRTDQKFCDAYCRSSWHNKLRSATRKQIRIFGQNLLGQEDKIKWSR